MCRRLSPLNPTYVYLDFYSKVYNYLDITDGRGYKPRQRWSKLSEGELRRHQPEKNRGQRNIDSLSSSKGRDALCNTPIHNQFLREKSFFGIEKHLEWSTQLWSNVLFIYHLFTAPFTALNAHRVSLFCGVGVTEVLEPSILKTDECGSVIR